jgi:hypothetical protein
MGKLARTGKMKMRKKFWPGRLGHIAQELVHREKIVGRKDIIWFHGPQAYLNIISAIEINWLMLFIETLAVCSENHTEPINTLCEQTVEIRVFNVKVGGTYYLPLCFKETAHI